MHKINGHKTEKLHAPHFLLMQKNSQAKVE